MHCFAPKLIDEIFSVSNDDAQAMAYDLLTRHGYQPTAAALYTYAPGTIPVCLVAHTDTVHDGPPEVIYHDPNKNVLWSPTGLGADDRAGILAIAAILETGLRPHVLLTDCEETGGQGAEAACAEMLPLPVGLLVQLDRQGATDAVYYSCHNRRLRRWVSRFGFKTAQGTFSDISILMPWWELPGVNLSVGYYNQHSRAEYLRLDELSGTVQAVCRMLQSPRAFKYRRRVERIDFFRLGDYQPRYLRNRRESYEREYLDLQRWHNERDDYDPYTGGIKDDLP